MPDRHLDWQGAFNARDLGGLPAEGGRTTRRGAAVRADALDGLSAAGWLALRAHGVRTVIDLRNEDERGGDRAPRPAGLTSVHLPLDGTDAAFWGRWGSGPAFSTPLYYGSHLERFPELSARVLAAIAHAPAGGVAFHCVGGRDRTGQISMLLLALLGVAPEAIAADYALSTERLCARYAARGEEDEGPILEEFLASEGTSSAGVIVSTVTTFDVGALLGDGGLRADDVSALRCRLLAG